MGRIVAHGKGDARNIFLILDGELAELTPMDDTHAAASDMARGLNQRFYLKRSYDALNHAEHWTAFDTRNPNPGVGTAKRTFPNRDAAIMYAVMKRR